MGWFRGIGHPQADEHEGWAALVLDDDTLSSEHSDRTRGRVTGWRAACDCGWSSTTTFVPGEPIGDRTAAPRLIEANAFDEWTQHVHDAVPGLVEYERQLDELDELAAEQPHPHDELARRRHSRPPH
ncbi:MAG: hypothetical protein L0H64_07215 [Pseudonocardia sp.]|nr:hypothetical protein [Pseudonocardia sp.]